MKIFSLAITFHGYGIVLIRTLLWISSSSCLLHQHEDVSKKMLASFPAVLIVCGMARPCHRVLTPHTSHTFPVVFFAGIVLFPFFYHP